MWNTEYERALMPDKPVDFDDVPWLEMGPSVVMDDPFEPGAVSLRKNPFCSEIEPVGSFKQYLMGHFFRDYINFMKEQTENGVLPGLEKHLLGKGSVFFSANRVDIENIEFYSKSQSEIYVDIIFDLDIQCSYVRRLYAPNYISKRYRLHTCASLAPECLSFNHILSLTEYCKYESFPGVPLDDYLIPYTGTELLEMESDIFLSLYYPEALKTPQIVNGLTLSSRMGLSVQYLNLADSPDVRGQIYFECQPLEILAADGKRISVSIPANTIVVNLAGPSSHSGAMAKEKVNDTIVHECFHAYRHRLFYLGQRLYNNSLRCLSCNIRTQSSSSAMDLNIALLNNTNPDRASAAADRLSVKNPVDWVEWQANRVTPRIRMPAQSFSRKAGELMQKHIRLTETERLERTISELSAIYGVSKQSAKLRMVELGWTAAKGVLNFVDGRYVENYHVEANDSPQNETYTIGLIDALQLYRESEKFRSVIRSGHYQYVDGHYCLASRKYLYRRNGVLFLTQYAKEHMRECCLSFTVSKFHSQQDYREGVLQKKEGYKDPFSLYLANKADNGDLWEASKKLSKIIENLPAKAGPTLCFHMTQRKMSIECLTSYSGVSPRTIKRLRSASCHYPKKETALAICIGLRLEPALSSDWLRKMGISFSSSPSDILYQFILSSMYWQPISAINSTIQSFGFKPLGENIEEIVH